MIDSLKPIPRVLTNCGADLTSPGLPMAATPSQGPARSVLLTTRSVLLTAHEGSREALSRGLLRLEHCSEDVSGRGDGPRGHVPAARG